MWVEDVSTGILCQTYPVCPWSSSFGSQCLSKETSNTKELASVPALHGQRQLQNKRWFIPSRGDKRSLSWVWGFYLNPKRVRWLPLSTKPDYDLKHMGIRKKATQTPALYGYWNPSPMGYVTLHLSPSDDRRTFCISWVQDFRVLPGCRCGCRWKPLPRPAGRLSGWYRRPP